MSDISIEEISKKLTAAFIPEKSTGVNAVVQIQITGINSGNYILTIKDQKCSLLEGTVPNPNLNISATAQDLLDIFTGKMDGAKAYMQGKLKMSGMIALAMKLLTLFKM